MPQLPRLSLLRSVAAVVLAGGLLLEGSSQAQAQDEVIENTLHPRVNSFFRSMSNGNGLERAFEELLLDGPLEESDRIDGMIEQVQQLEAQYGAMLSTERVGAKRVGTDLVLLTYLFKTEKFPVVWRFAFYRPPTVSDQDSPWIVISVRFDTSLQMLELLDS